MTVENNLSGWLIISDIINSQRVEQKYMGYSRAEAKRMFKQYVKEKFNQTIKFPPLKKSNSTIY